ncbi:hypothetical protein [Alkalihalobacillus sp. 1P02AB]|uniref:hypothetical protein n=1 Tax=Alkalihalobacillus sp. 1P02AB TaxID=3132260 RepID=UPI0039A4E55F
MSFGVILVIAMVVLPAMGIGAYSVKKDYELKERRLEVRELELELEMKKLDHEERKQLSSGTYHLESEQRPRNREN